MKIIHIIENLNKGGAQVMLYKLLSRMNGGKFESGVVSLTDAGELENPIRELKIPLYSLGLSKSVFSIISGILRLSRILGREKPDVLQTWLYHSDLLGLLAGKMAGLPRIFWNIRCSQHDLHSPGSVIRLLAYLSRFPDAVIVNSEAGKLYHEKKGYRPKRWCYLPNGFDLDTFKPLPESRKRWRDKLGIPEHAVLFGLIARYDPLKDHPTFLRAAQIVSSRSEKARFLLAGRDMDENNPSLLNLCKELNLEKQIFLLGKREKIPELLSALDVAVSSSLSEGFPNMVGEAMACGIPCVTSDAGESARIVGNAGIVVPPGDPEALAKGMLEVLEISPLERRTLGEEARKRIMLNYDIHEIVKQYEDLYMKFPQSPRSI